MLQWFNVIKIIDIKKGEDMNQEFVSVPVAEQLQEIEKADEVITTEYALASDGTISRDSEVEEEK